MANRLKQITTKAKALYKTGKFAKWTDAIKAASKQTASVSATKKKATKKKAVPKKKTAIKKAVSKKKAAAKSYHKDTKSHNVRINVVSGIKSDINFAVFVKGKKVLITKSPTTAVNEAKFYSTFLGVTAFVKSGSKTFSKFVNGKLIK